MRVLDTEIRGEYIIKYGIHNNPTQIFKVCKQAKPVLEQLAKANSFPYKSNWNTRQLGKALIDKYGKGNVAQILNYRIIQCENKTIFVYEEIQLSQFKQNAQAQISTQINQPGKQELFAYLALWHMLPNYNAQEKALAMLFQKKVKKNTDLSEILVKCATLNDFYSTHVRSSHAMALHIYKVQIDPLLTSGSLSLVDQIACLTTSKGKYVTIRLQQSIVAFISPIPIPYMIRLWRKSW